MLCVNVRVSKVIDTTLRRISLQKYTHPLFVQSNKLTPGFTAHSGLIMVKARWNIA